MVLRKMFRALAELAEDRRATRQAMGRLAARHELRSNPDEPMTVPKPLMRMLMLEADSDSSGSELSGTESEGDPDERVDAPASSPGASGGDAEAQVPHLDDVAGSENAHPFAGVADGVAGAPRVDELDKAEVGDRPSGRDSSRGRELRRTSFGGLSKQRRANLASSLAGGSGALSLLGADDKAAEATFRMARLVTMQLKRDSLDAWARYMSQRRRARETAKRLMGLLFRQAIGGSSLGWGGDTMRNLFEMWKRWTALRHAQQNGLPPPKYERVIAAWEIVERREHARVVRERALEVIRAWRASARERKAHRLLSRTDGSVADSLDSAGELVDDFALGSAPSEQGSIGRTAGAFTSSPGAIVITGAAGAFSPKLSLAGEGGGGLARPGLGLDAGDTSRLSPHGSMSSMASSRNWRAALTSTKSVQREQSPLAAVARAERTVKSKWLAVAVVLARTREPLDVASDRLPLTRVQFGG
ncbi:hypothetical protein FNF29_02025 [Cafeteria roenbergensis]|uniref:Sfi1 spindle body domain-containing protein n=1 Tax=Cafeteria roenbergensis TaxID=33653 RepID=A0A5A8CR03_CAFRO|nr:hypothetical protein FNF29_02025 [Cafeteria roenbergensis]|eukprot:KAA0154884.1 hypothetical protein FNF29_02025 [Cafeteria roenbergensis]